MKTFNLKHWALSAFVGICISIMNYSSIKVQAEPGYEDTDYWFAKCGTSSTDYDEEGCAAFTQSLVNQNEEYQAAQLEVYGQQIAEIQANIDAIQAEMNAKQYAIDQMQFNIDARQAEINAKENDVGQIRTAISETKAEISRLKKEIQYRRKTNRTAKTASKYRFIIEIKEARETITFLTDQLDHLQMEIEPQADEIRLLQAQFNEQLASYSASQELLKAEKEKIEIIAAEAKRAYK